MAVRFVPALGYQRCQCCGVVTRIDGDCRGCGSAGARPGPTPHPPAPPGPWFSTIVALALVAVLAALGSKLALPKTPGAAVASLPPATLPRVPRVMVVVLENTDYEDALAQPFLGRLAREGGLLTAYFAVSHPSQPNYLAMTAGSLLGVSSDGPVTLDARHLGDLLEARGRAWKVYAEQYPGNCFTGPRAGAYVRKHVPFLSFRNVVETPARCGRIVEASALATDVREGALPDYALYVPDLRHDGHDTGVRAADAWLAATFGPLVRSARFRRDVLLVVTFDEGRRYRGNRVYTALSGDAVRPGAVSGVRYDHYSLLRTIEEVLGLGSLDREDATATPIGEIWR